VVPKLSGKYELEGKASKGEFMSIDLVIHNMLGYESQTMHFEGELRMMNRICDGIHEGVIVSIGSYRGQMDCALALHAHVPVYCIDQRSPSRGEDTPFGDIDRVYWMQNILAMNVGHKVRPINLSSELVGKIWTQDISLLWIDGSHDTASVLADLDAFVPCCGSGSLIAFHDANTPGVMAAIEDMKDSLELVEMADITAVYKLVDRVSVPEGLAQAIAGPGNSFRPIHDEDLPPSQSEPVRATEDYALAVGHGPHPSQTPKSAPKKKATKK
jgi:hypothetical protein